MKKTITTLQNLATGKTVLILFILTMSVYLTMLLVTIPKVESYASDMALFDLSPGGYSHQHALSLLDTLGEEGRQVYLTRQLPADFIYPGLFAIAYTLLLAWLFAKSFNPDSKIFYLALIPILGGLFDYMENIGIILMIYAYPDLSRSLVAVSNVFTILKSIFTTGFFILLFVGAAAWGITKLKGERQQTEQYQASG